MLHLSQHSDRRAVATTCASPRIGECVKDKKNEKVDQVESACPACATRVIFDKDPPTRKCMIVAGHHGCRYYSLELSPACGFVLKKIGVHRLRYIFEKLNEHMVGLIMV